MAGAEAGTAATAAGCSARLVTASLGCLLLLGALALGPAARPAAAQSAAPAETVSPDAFELTFWDTIRNSKNPEDFRAYLEAFPKGRFAPLARIRLRQNGGDGPGPTDPEALEAFSGDFVASEATPVLARPAPDGPRLGSLRAGEAVRVTGRHAATGLVRVERRDGKPGFVAAERLKPVGGPPAAGAGQGGPSPDTAGAAVAAGRPGEPVTDCADCPEMVRIPAGSFEMGANELFDFEKPVHRVTLARPFLIGRYEVTVRQWEVCSGEGACPAKVGPAMDGSLPVTDVTWGEARGYATWLARKTGRRYRLPSEAEWEYAVRGGGKTTYPWGAQLIRERANCLGCNATSLRRVLPVGRFPPNEFGLHDMAGNAAEWVEDCWFDNYRGAPADGSARDSANCRERVLRGGSFGNDPRYLRSAARFKYDAEVRYYGNGFRVLREE